MNHTRYLIKRAFQGERKHVFGNVLLAVILLFCFAFTTVFSSVALIYVHAKSRFQTPQPILELAFHEAKTTSNSADTVYGFDKNTCPMSNGDINLLEQQMGESFVGVVSKPITMTFESSVSEFAFYFVSDQYYEKMCSEAGGQGNIFAGGNARHLLEKHAATENDLPFYFDTDGRAVLNRKNTLSTMDIGQIKNYPTVYFNTWKVKQEEVPLENTVLLPMKYYKFFYDADDHINMHLYFVYNNNDKQINAAATLLDERHKEYYTYYPVKAGTARSGQFYVLLTDYGLLFALTVSIMARTAIGYYCLMRLRFEKRKKNYKIDYLLGAKISDLLWIERIHILLPILPALIGGIFCTVLFSMLVDNINGISIAFKPEALLIPVAFSIFIVFCAMRYPTKYLRTL